MSKGAPLSLSPATRELLEQVVREGSLDGSLAALGSSPSNRMNSKFADGAKRRLTSDGEFDEQLPVHPRAKATETGLPDGVASMTEWGQTLIVSGKYTKDQMSYAELAKFSAQVHVAYCTWLITQKDRSDLTAPIPDLVSYLVRQLIQGLFRRQHHCPKA